MITWGPRDGEFVVPKEEVAGTLDGGEVGETEVVGISTEELDSKLLALLRLLFFGVILSPESWRF
jgi:hypothetical protein